MIRNEQHSMADVDAAVARAVMAERKRCALVALSTFALAREGEAPGDYEWASRTAANCIAGAIACKIMGEI